MHQDAVLEETANYLSSGQVDLPLPILHSSLPVPLVEGTVGPEHLAVALPPVLHEVALVEVAAGEVQLAVAFLESLSVAAGVLGLPRRPLALAVPQPVSEPALIGGLPLLPAISAEPIKPIVLVLPFEGISIGEPCLRELTSIP